MVKLLSGTLRTVVGWGLKGKGGTVGMTVSWLCRR